MKVKIKDLVSGRIKTMESRYADVLVKMKRAEYYVEPKIIAKKPIVIKPAREVKPKEASKTYSTKVLQADVDFKNKDMEAE